MASAATSLGSPELPAGHVRSGRVLVVLADSESAREAWERLRADGLGDAVASTRAEAEQQLEEGRFDVVLIDAELSFVSGLLDRLRRERPFPAILLTGALDAQRAFRYSRAGVSGYLPAIQSAEQVRREVEHIRAEIPSLEATFARHVGRTRLHTLLGQARSLMFEQAIAMEGGSRSGAARLLGVSRQAVQQWSSTVRTETR